MKSSHESLSSNLDNEISDFCDQNSFEQKIKTIISKGDTFSLKQEEDCECYCLNRNEKRPGKSKYRALRIFIVICTLISRFFNTISQIFLLITYAISFYSIIIICYIFFVSAIIAYIFSPILHALSQDWIQYSFSIMQIILANPLIEFFLLFIFHTMMKLADSFMELFSYIKLSFLNLYSIYLYEAECLEDNSYVEEMRNSNYKKSVLFDITGSLFAAAISSAVVYLSFSRKNYIIILGSFLYLSIVIQIVILMVPCYTYFFRILFGSKEKYHPPTKSEKLIKFLNDKYETLMHENLPYAEPKDDKETQTYDCAFHDPVFQALDLSSNSEFSSGEWFDNEEIEKGEHIRKILFYSLVHKVLPIIFALEYRTLYDYTREIFHDKYNANLKRPFLIVFSLLNALVLVFDAYRLADTLSLIFLVSFILRVLAFPLISYFHIGTIFIFKNKNRTFNLIRWASAIFTLVVVVVSIILLFCIHWIFGVTPINNLEYIQNTTSPKSAIFHQACVYNYKGLSLIDAFGLSLGPYDVERNFTIFDNQMKYFFGPEWNATIKYEVQHIDKNTPFIIYTINDSLVVYAFRGASAGTELCLQIEMLANQYLLPLLQDIVPLFDFIVDNFVSYFAKYAHIIGSLFFDPVSIVNVFVDPIETVIKSQKFIDNTTALFTGIGVGGLISKAMGMVHKKQGIGFISFPTFNDYFRYALDFDDEDSIFVTNLFNYDGFFTLPEPKVATNIGIPYVTNPFPLRRDEVYQTFCTMAEMCGFGPKFTNYCSAVISNVDEITKYFESYQNMSGII